MNVACIVSIRESRLLEISCDCSSFFNYTLIAQNYYFLTYIPVIFVPGLYSRRSCDVAAVATVVETRATSYLIAPYLFPHEFPTTVNHRRIQFHLQRKSIPWEMTRLLIIVEISASAAITVTSLAVIADSSRVDARARASSS